MCAEDKMRGLSGMPVVPGMPVFPGMEERWAAVSGCRLRYLVGGSGASLVLVHGIAASSFSFRLNCAELMRDFRLYIPDIRIPSADGSLAATALRLRDFLDHLGIRRSHILGSSHGGSVVMELAALSPERFGRMVLVSPTNPFAENYKKVVRFYLSGVGGIFVRLAPLMPGRAWDYGISRMYADRKRISAGTGIGYALPLRQRGMIPHILSSLRTLTTDIEALRPKLAAISKVPTLLVWGDRDPVVELESGHRLQQALAAEMEVMRGVGHLPYEENPTEFNRIVRHYLRKPRTGPSDDRTMG
jgi:pimeloyl-ACP methyl ester carboxylesterase